MKSLKKTRIQAGYTQKELSELTGIPQSNISELENGHVTSNCTTKQRIEAVLGVVDWLESEAVLISGTYAEAQKLVKQLVGIYSGSDAKERKAIKRLIFKYFN